VVATTPDLKSLTEAVAGGAVRGESLVPPGAGAEAFEPRPGHLALVRRAALVIRVGLGYDDWLDRLLLQAGNARLQRGQGGYLDLSTEIALLEVQGRSVEPRSGHAHGSANPHYWLDPANAEAMSASIAEALIRVQPEHRETVAAAHARFVADLKERLQRWTRMLEPHRGAAIVAYHNSWPYFARRFRINIVAVIEEKEGVAPSPTRLARIIAQAKSANARIVIRETYEPEEAPRLVAGRIGASIVGLAAGGGGGSGVKDHIGLFDYNIAVLLRGLGG